MESFDSLHHQHEVQEAVSEVIAENHLLVTPETAAIAVEVAEKVEAFGLVAAARQADLYDSEEVDQALSLVGDALAALPSVVDRATRRELIIQKHEHQQSRRAQRARQQRLIVDIAMRRVSKHLSNEPVES